MLFVVSPMNSQSVNDNELNNLIYVFLKYTFKFEEPRNSDIATIMKAIGNNRDRSNVIQEAVKYVGVRYGRDKLGNLTEMLKHMNFIFGEFFSLPDNLRNDLGEDKEAHEFIVQN